MVKDNDRLVLETNRQKFVEELIVDDLPGFIQTVCRAVPASEGKNEEVFAIGALALACLKRLASYGT